MMNIIALSGPKICQIFLERLRTEIFLYTEKPPYVMTSTNSLSVFLNFGIGCTLVSSNVNAP